ncbi:possible membrane associated protease [Geminocystis sp. NIES-3708]|uniref:type II CAAX endopeptidase family protein n=1 Tax=Geminocystis sp. NIES-3708 TaxID=1615909 RepID=UPI0005FC9781|nr:type II CAAX endopeptidase family protein [Geminocystis sp. NIES-3708]BAQ62537.1 possible membrane associated protease [Geminocystis sp. NIES-3708]
MNWKRSLLAILTVISMYSVFFALSQSLGEPQVQAQLELYQTNLILNASSLNQSSNPSISNDDNVSNIAQGLIGNDPYGVAQNQYEKALIATKDSLHNLQEKNNSLSNSEKAIASESPRQQLKQNIEQNQNLVNNLNLKLGIICAKENNLKIANNYWSNISDEELKEVLINIWDKKLGGINNKLEEIVSEKLDGWFKLNTLAQLYKNQNDLDKLSEIKSQQKIIAEKSIYRLFSLSIIPVFGGLVGFGLIIFLIIQLVIKKETSILATNYNRVWQSPWDWEIIWQVFIVGFFFLSQVLLPLLFGLSGFNPSSFSIKGKALYVLVSYFFMAGGGLLVLYLSLKSFFPLPEGWFNLTNKKWYLWGIGGYLVAIPSVFLVSILNQQLWQGRGGSNPLLLLALESQDKFALAIFFLTASIAAPIFEEIMFRGFLLPSLTRYLPVWGAIVVSGIIFAVAHLSLAEIIPLATLGIILGIVYTRSRSLLASITLHSLWNSGTLFSLFVLGSKIN